MTARSLVPLLLLAVLGCKTKCERAVEQRLGAALPAGAKLESCQYSETTALKNAFELNAVFEADDSLSDLADRWDTQEGGLSPKALFLLVEYGEYTPNDDVAPDRAPDGAIHLRAHVLSVLRKLGPSRYRLRALNVEDDHETERRRN